MEHPVLFLLLSRRELVARGTVLICRIGQKSEDSFDRQCIIFRISRISEDFCSAMFDLPHHLSVGCPKITLFSIVPDLSPISKSSLL